MASHQASHSIALMGVLSLTDPHFMFSPSLTLVKTLTNFFQLIIEVLIHARAKG